MYLVSLLKFLLTNTRCTQLKIPKDIDNADVTLSLMVEAHIQGQRASACCYRKALCRKCRNIHCHSRPYHTGRLCRQFVRLFCWPTDLEHPHARRPVAIELPNGKVLCVQWRDLTKPILFNRENIQ